MLFNFLEDGTIKSHNLSTDTNGFASLITSTLEDCKANDIVVIDLHGKSDMADYMIIASGTSDRHVVSIAHRLHDALKKAESPYLAMEGQETAEWVLVDTGDVVIHLFKPEAREYYNLEKMWAAPASQTEEITG